MTSDDIGRRSLSEWQWDGEPGNTVARRSSEVNAIFAKSVIWRLKHSLSYHIDAFLGDVISVARPKLVHTSGK